MGIEFEYFWHLMHPQWSGRGGLGVKISNIIFWSETIPPCVMECVRGILSWKTWFKYRKYLIEVSDIANFTFYFEKLQIFIWD